MRATNLLSGFLTAMLLVCGGLVAAAEPAAPDAGALIQALRKGGCYIVMRHASSPREVPSAADATPGNADRERQLDAQGKATARAMGAALRRLQVPVTAVFSSPTWRAQETAMEAGFPKPVLVPELGDGGRSMAATGDAQAAWLKQKVTQPVAGGNTVVITHFPNLRSAFPEYAASLADGEALVFVPDASGGTRMLRHVRIEEWPAIQSPK